jgi:hypothetical protein
MWLVVIDEHHAHLTSNGNVYGTVNLGALKWKQQTDMN